MGVRTLFGCHYLWVCSHHESRAWHAPCAPGQGRGNPAWTPGLGVGGPQEEAGGLKVGPREDAEARGSRQDTEAGGTPRGRRGWGDPSRMLDAGRGRRRGGGAGACNRAGSRQGALGSGRPRPSLAPPFKMIWPLYVLVSPDLGARVLPGECAWRGPAPLPGRARRRGPSPCGGRRGVWKVV